jgi:hypothetical protein
MRDFKAIRFLGAAAIVAAIAGTAACTQSRGSDPLDEAYGRLVFALGDSSLSMWKRATARIMLSEADKDVIPVLISALGDKRTFDPEYIGPGASFDAKPQIQTVGLVSEVILYRVISGREPRRYHVFDWGRWWEQNQSKKLSEIIEMVRANSEPIK